MSAIDAVVWALAAAASAGVSVVWACALALCELVRAPRRPDAPLLPMTLIKPLKGLDDALAENLESIARADPAAAVQVVAAVESAEDPAHAVVAAFAARHPERDIQIVVSGPHGGRMGKTHNMIAGLARAKHPRIIFSDADVATTPALLAETSAAFAAGKGAVFALPRHRRVRGLGGLLFEAAMNHAFAPASALGWRLGLLRCSAGAWMAYTRDALERSGGLEPIVNSIADDFALSTRVLESGADAELLGVPAPLSETGTSLREALPHLAKWASILRSAAPWPYGLAPLLSPGVVAAVLLVVCETTGRHAAVGRAVAAAAFGSRALAAAVVDGKTDGRPGPLWTYALLSLSDLGALGFWLAGFRREIRWRGVRYRLFRGGRAEVLSA